MQMLLIKTKFTFVAYKLILNNFKVMTSLKIIFIVFNLFKFLNGFFITPHFSFIKLNNLLKKIELQIVLLVPE